MYYCWQTMIKTMCLEVFQSCSKLYILCKVRIELMQKVLCISAQLDRSKLRLDRSNLGQNVFFYRFPTQPQLFKMFQGFLICPKYKRQTLATFQCCSYCYLCKSLVRSTGAFFYTNLGFSRRRYCLHLDDQLGCFH